MKVRIRTLESFNNDPRVKIVDNNCLIYHDNSECRYIHPHNFNMFGRVYKVLYKTPYDQINVKRDLFGNEATVYDFMIEEYIPEITDT